MLWLPPISKTECWPMTGVCHCALSPYSPPPFWSGGMDTMIASLLSTLRRSTDNNEWRTSLASFSAGFTTSIFSNDILSRPQRYNRSLTSITCTYTCMYNEPAPTQYKRHFSQLQGYVREYREITFQIHVNKHNKNRAIINLNRIF